MKLLLDTHATILALAEPSKLGRAARAVMARIEAGRGEAWIPAAVIAEIVLLHQARRTGIGIAQVRAAMSAGGGVRFLALDLAQLDAFAALGSIRDPFDRLILAAARTVGARLVTRDAVLAESGLVEVLWS